MDGVSETAMVEKLSLSFENSFPGSFSAGLANISELLSKDEKLSTEEGRFSEFVARTMPKKLPLRLIPLSSGMVGSKSVDTSPASNDAKLEDPSLK